MRRLFVIASLSCAATALTVWPLPRAEASLAQGARAPEFTAQGAQGGRRMTVSLRNALRRGPVVLYFFPRAFTSGCTIEAQRFQRDLADYQARHVQILGVSADSVDSHAEFCDAEGIEFPLLSDPNGQVSKAYGSWLGAASLRHTYIIDPDGILRAQFLGVRPVIHSKEVLATLDDLQAST